MNAPSVGTSAGSGNDSGGADSTGTGTGGTGGTGCCGGSGAARVLVLDDNEMLRGLLSRILVGAGLQVSEAASVEEALRLNPGAYDAVVLDIRLEGRPGTDLVDELRRSDPGAVRRCLLLTGAPGLDQVPPDVPVVGKPFTADQIVGEVRRILRAEGPGHRPVEAGPVAAGPAEPG
ncbi:response regulator [Frankia sp. AiPa1]|uniref:response regulator n=1 Tax=Frankia sp. AiPa1 TaxID=573492 RepID=UPI00202AF474|nr:response regulator [Frankia sp. AiPa1]MCL9762032.1 response regulator [Frankia sp. AiPa1]